MIYADDIQLNPGPRKNNTSYNFSLCHWHLNSSALQSFLKLFLLEAYIKQRKFDIIYLLETCLDTFIPPDDQRLYMEGHKSITADNPCDSKKGSVAIYYKEFLAVRSVEVKNLNECVIFEVSSKNIT